MSQGSSGKGDFTPRLGFKEEEDAKSLSFSIAQDQQSLRSDNFFIDSERKESEQQVISEPHESAGLNEAFFNENSECVSAGISLKPFGALDEKTQINFMGNERLSLEVNMKNIILKSPDQTAGKAEDQPDTEKVVKVSQSKNCCQRFCVTF